MVMGSNMATAVNAGDPPGGFHLPQSKWTVPTSSEINAANTLDLWKRLANATVELATAPVQNPLLAASPP